VFEIPGFMFSAKTVAEQDMKYVFVKMSADGVAPATSATDAVIGVAQRKGIATEALPIMASGISMMVAGGKIAKGAKVAPGTDGKAVTATDAYCGVALEAATADGDVLPVLLMLGAGAAAAGGDVYGLPAGGTEGQVLVKQGATAGQAQWVTLGKIPTGGTANQVLTKSDGTDYNVKWADVPAASP
jgi:hypothetical protein